MKLIQQHYDVLDIDPNFRTSNEAENVLLLDQTIDDVLERHYDILDPDFIDLTEQLSSDRNDDQFRDIIKRMYFFSIANPNPFEWLNQLSHPYRDEEQQAQLLKLLNDLAMIFLKAAHEEIQKSFDLFSMLEDVEKHLEVVEDECRFVSKVIEGEVIHTDTLVSHQFVSRFPSISKKIKETNEGMEEALNDAKKHYDHYKELVTEVKNNYFSRSAEDLKLDMQNWHRE